MQPFSHPSGVGGSETKTNDLNDLNVMLSAMRSPSGAGGSVGIELSEANCQIELSEAY
ncbi:MAG: hypothetical protein IPO92_16640 [Saprospiraceae bacterium]|nr:hypothetical protein [Saprospiraceae bacterium]